MSVRTIYHEKYQFNVNRLCLYRLCLLKQYMYDNKSIANTNSTCLWELQYTCNIIKNISLWVKSMREAVSDQV